MDIRKLIDHTLLKPEASEEAIKRICDEAKEHGFKSVATRTAQIQALPSANVYPIDATYGKVLKAPKEYSDVRGQVVADYQDQLEKEWVARLRQRYAVVVNKDVLATVNKH